MRFKIELNLSPIFLFLIFRENQETLMGLIGLKLQNTKKVYTLSAPSLTKLTFSKGSNKKKMSQKVEKDQKGGEGSAPDIKKSTIQNVDFLIREGGRP